MRWDRDGSKTSTRSPSPSIHSGMADVVQAFDIIQAFMRLTAASHLREPRALNEPVLPLPVLAHHKPWGALPWPPWRSTRLLARDPAAWELCCRRRRKLFERLKVMSLCGSNDRSVPEGGNPVLSGVAGSRKAAERLRLAQALRANLGRRKAQKRERRKQTADAAESKTARGEGAQNGASTKQD
jgi:hypothetical protein